MWDRFGGAFYSLSFHYHVYTNKVNSGHESCLYFSAVIVDFRFSFIALAMMHRMILSSSRRAAASLQSTTTTSRGVLSATRFFSSAAAIADDDDVNDGRFSIQGTFREGQASYLDMSSTTPLDPRVLDKMMPYMVSSLEVM